MTIRTRFAPSPTGYLHIGGVRTALFSWLYARAHHGQFILRIEDTDRERSTQESIDAILSGIGWLGLDYDEGPFYQSKRFNRYHEAIRRLTEAGKAYPCFCSRERLEELRVSQMQQKLKPRYDGRCRDGKPADAAAAPVIRFKTPQTGSVGFEDLVHGPTAFSNSELDDLIIARADGTPTYNLTVVVDDLDMRISHVIRGDDHLNNTPRQIHIFDAIGAPPPRYAHVSMILGKDGKRLSKRHGAVSVLQYRDDGYLPEALLNYLVRLGWSHGDQEIFSLPELVEKFDIENVNKAAATFDPEKLRWLNQQYIKAAEADRLRSLFAHCLERRGIDYRSGPPLADVAEAMRERAPTLVEMADNTRFFFEEFAEFDEKAATKHLKATDREALAVLRQKFEALPEWSAQAIHQEVTATAENLGLQIGGVAQPLRVAVTGGAVSPPIDVTVKLIGKSRTLARLGRALEYIDAHADS